MTHNLPPGIWWLYKVILSWLSIVLQTSPTSRRAPTCQWLYRQVQHQEVHRTLIVLAIQDFVRIVDPFWVVPTPINFFYLNHWVFLDDLFTMDFGKRRDYRDFTRRGPLETIWRRSREFGRWRSRRLIRLGGEKLAIGHAMRPPGHLVPHQGRKDPSQGAPSPWCTWKPTHLHRSSHYGWTSWLRPSLPKSKTQRPPEPQWSLPGQAVSLVMGPPHGAYWAAPWVTQPQSEPSQLLRLGRQPYLIGL